MITAAPIRLLPPAVADAIAAGEVVERPAAVVKELIENALDAGAGRIDVTVDGGGLTRITVADDGAGIAPEQLALAVSRHATSKIERVDDLAAITSLGFRGEALASIAAVSDLRLRSRRRGGDRGAEIHVRGGEVLAEAVAAMAEGTVVEVCDLFVVTPARLAFLRQPRAEAQAAVRTVADSVLARPGVAFTCTVDGRLVLRSHAHGIEEAAAAVFGGRAAAELRRVAADGEVAVTGLVSEPRAHRGDRNHLVLLVNGRRVHNRALVVAVEEAYRGLLPGGRHPYGVLDIHCDPARVDVNVHPTKREVRFRDDRLVFSAVQRACSAALQDARLVAVPAAVAAAAPQPAELPQAELLLGEPAPDEIAASASSPSAADARLGDLAPLRAVGQVGAGWLVAESPRGLVLVDPHAAHEKLLYTELLAATRAADAGAPPMSQMLLVESVVDVGAEDLAGDPDLRRLGFDLEEYGPGMVRVRAVPAAAATADCERLLRDAAAERGDDRLHRLAALCACHAAVRLGDPLDPLEQQSLLDRLPGVPEAMTCPHGRPTVQLLDDPTLRRMFRRPAV